MPQLDMSNQKYMFHLLLPQQNALSLLPEFCTTTSSRKPSMPTGGYSAHLYTHTFFHNLTVICYLKPQYHLLSSGNPYFHFVCYLFNFYVDLVLISQEHYKVLGDATLSSFVSCLLYTRTPEYCYVHIKGSIII